MLQKSQRKVAISDPKQKDFSNVPKVYLLSFPAIIGRSIFVNSKTAKLG